MICKECGSLKVENRDLQLCASCNKLHRKISNIKLPEEKEPIKKQSEEMKRLMAIYVRQKMKWIKGKMCAVLKNVPATDVHHSAGRSINEFYDEWARERNICLLLDERFWIPVSREGHIEIENRPDWAKLMGYSESRLTVKK